MPPGTLEDPFDELACAQDGLSVTDATQCPAPIVRRCSDNPDCVTCTSGAYNRCQWCGTACLSESDTCDTTSAVSRNECSDTDARALVTQSAALGSLSDTALSATCDGFSGDCDSCLSLAPHCAYCALSLTTGECRANRPSTIGTCATVANCAVFAAKITAGECVENPDCATCVAASRGGRCGYCPQSNTCLPRAALDTFCSNGNPNVTLCAETTGCATISDCASCLRHSPCAWCGTRCVEADVSCEPTETRFLETCPSECDTLTCQQAQEHPRCKWCMSDARGGYAAPSLSTCDSVPSCSTLNDVTTCQDCAQRGGTWCLDRADLSRGLCRSNDLRLNALTSLPAESTEAVYGRQGQCASTHVPTVDCTHAEDIRRNGLCEVNGDCTSCLGDVAGVSRGTQCRFCSATRMCLERQQLCLGRVTNGTSSTAATVPDVLTTVSQCAALRNASPCAAFKTCAQCNVAATTFGVQCSWQRGGSGDTFCATPCPSCQTVPCLSGCSMAPLNNCAACTALQGCLYCSGDGTCVSETAHTVARTCPTRP
ncbi:MAG: hypothetical protein MHM6MM_008728, partial [Cercozoa sp. M6MM]